VFTRIRRLASAILVGDFGRCQLSKLAKLALFWGFLPMLDGANSAILPDGARLPYCHLACWQTD